MAGKREPDEEEGDEETGDNTRSSHLQVCVCAEGWRLSLDKKHTMRLAFRSNQRVNVQFICV